MSTRRRAEQGGAAPFLEEHRKEYGEIITVCIASLRTTSLLDSRNGRCKSAIHCEPGFLLCRVDGSLCLHEGVMIRTQEIKKQHVYNEICIPESGLQIYLMIYTLSIARFQH